MLRIADALRRTIMISFVAVFAVGGLTAAVSAQQGDSGEKRESITLSPTKRIYRQDPGTVIEDKLTIVNDGETDYDFIAYARPYSVEGADYAPNFDSPVKNADLYKWVQFESVSYHAKAGATVNVPFTIRIPSDAAPGGHYGAVFTEIQVSKKNDSKESAILRNKRVGMLAFLTVNGTIDQSGSDKGVDIKLWQPEPPMIASATLQNSGNVHLDHTITMTVRDVLGNVKYRTTKEVQVLPGTTRTTDMEWSKSPWFGLFKVEIESKYLDNTELHSGYVIMMPRFIPFIVVVLVVLGGVHAAYGKRRGSGKKGYRR